MPPHYKIQGALASELRVRVERSWLCSAGFTSTPYSEGWEGCSAGCCSASSARASIPRAKRFSSCCFCARSGGAIGYFVVSVDSIRDQSLVFVRLATYGVLLGAFGGVVGMLIAGPVHDHLLERIGAVRGSAIKYLATVFLRGLGFLFLGLAVGFSEGVAVVPSLGKMSYGGALGGAGPALSAAAYSR